MEIAIHARAVGIFLAGAAGVFHASSFAAVEDGSLAMQDLTAKFSAPVAVVAGSPAKASGSAVRRLEYGICNVTYASLSDSSQAERDDLAAWRNRMNPIGYAYEVWSKKRHEEFFGVDRGQAKDFEWLAKWEKSLKVSVLRAPAHGRLSQLDQESDMRLTPDVDYVGKDRVDLLVTGKDDLMRPFALTLRYHINVVGRESGPGLNAIKHPGSKGLCGTVKNSWRISELNSEGETYSTSGSDNVAQWLRSVELSSLIAGAGNARQGFTNLAGSAVGTTVGEGETAQITLDSDAAGHGWYVDPTPLDNTDDYLPTSDPNIWQAKAGSVADNKMDMLSALLHEYDHALGLEHSADVRDFMATTLTPGVRRLPIAS